MRYALREIKSDDIDRIRVRAEHRAFLSLFPEYRRYFRDVLADPESYEGYTAALENGEVLGIGLCVFPEEHKSVGVMCVYATDLFRKYPVAVVKAAREIVNRVIEQRRPKCLMAYAHRSEPGIMRWMSAFGFERITTPKDAPAALNELDLYRKEIVNSELKESAHG